MKKILLFLVLICPMLSIGQIPDPIPGTYVQDHTGTLAPVQQAYLNAQLHSLDTEMKVSMAVVLIDHVPDNMQIEEYALQVGRKWHVGRGGNGLVYVMAIGDKKQRLEVSGHLEYIITDIQAHELTENFKSFFRSGHTYEGLTTMIRSIETMLKVEEKPVNKVVQKTDDVGIVILVSIGLSLLCVLLWLVVERHQRRVKAQWVKDNEEREEYLRKLHETDERQILGRLNRHPNRHRSIEEEEPKRRAYVVPIVIAEPEPDRSSSYSSPEPDRSSSSSDSSSSYDTGFSSSSDSGSSYDSGSSSDFSGGGSSNDL